MGKRRITVLTFVAMVVLALFSRHSQAQAALLLEQPYGFFGLLNPTGHNALYFERICAETPVMLRRCQAGELGVVISRYQGINDYDWVAIPLVPYLYAVENPSDVPARVDRATVARLRNHYHEAHLQSLGDDLPRGGLTSGGWKQLLGSSYERRIYAFRFDTTPEQDDALIERLNSGPNHTHFELFFSNCADFARVTLNTYFPRTFRRSIFPDAEVTTPKQITWKLVRYAHKHPDTHLEIFEIPQVPGYRHPSHPNKSIAESLSTTGYAVPIVLLNPYIACGFLADYLARGRYHPLIPRHPEVLGPENLSALTAPASAAQNPDSDGVQAPSAATSGSAETQPPEKANFGLGEIKVNHE
jgi:hypothetical protein